MYLQNLTLTTQSSICWEWASPMKEVGWPGWWTGKTATYQPCWSTSPLSVNHQNQCNGIMGGETELDEYSFLHSLTHIHMPARMHKCIRTRTHMYSYACARTYSYLRAHTRTHTHMHAHIHKYYACARIHTHTQTAYFLLAGRSNIN